MSSPLDGPPRSSRLPFHRLGLSCRRPHAKLTGRPRPHRSPQRLFATQRLRLRQRVTAACCANAASSRTARSCVTSGARLLDRQGQQPTGVSARACGCGQCRTGNDVYSGAVSRPDRTTSAVAGHASQPASRRTPAPRRAAGSAAYHVQRRCSPRDLPRPIHARPSPDRDHARILHLMRTSDIGAGHAWHPRRSVGSGQRGRRELPQAHALVGAQLPPRGELSQWMQLTSETW